MGTCMTSTGPTHKLTTTRKGGALDTLNCAAAHALLSAPACTHCLYRLLSACRPAQQVFNRTLAPGLQNTHSDLRRRGSDIWRSEALCFLLAKTNNCRSNARYCLPGKAVCICVWFYKLRLAAQTLCGYLRGNSICTAAPAQRESGQGSIAGSALQSQSSGPSGCASVDV